MKKEGGGLLDINRILYVYSGAQKESLEGAMVLACRSWACVRAGASATTLVGERATDEEEFKICSRRWDPLRDQGFSSKIDATDPASPCEAFWFPLDCCCSEKIDRSNGNGNGPAVVPPPCVFN